MSPDDPHDLARFRLAQDPVWPAVMRELTDGRKTSHWMWFVFPQLRALGRSGTAVRYGIEGLDEARAYLADATLAQRLEIASAALLAHEGTPADVILGPIDAMKLRSSATLFHLAGGALQDRLLAAFFDGQPDPQTIDILERAT